MPKIQSVGMVHLGCPKNQVNGERMLASLAEAGYTVMDPYDEPDAVIVNTCGFIDDAKREAIDTILEMADLKKEGLIKKVLVTGCLAEVYADEVRKEIPEVDAVLGLGANADIVSYLEQAEEEPVTAFPDKEQLPLGGERLRQGAKHWAYLSIAEGCSNRCAYCTIPAIRGPYRSRPQEEILEEARALAADGVKEVILIAQDTTRYGSDLYGEYRLPGLLRELCIIDSLKRIRLLYCYPDAVTDELIDTIAAEPKVCKYLDIPLQHINDGILRAMNRRIDKAGILSLLSKLRERIPGIALRTTLLVGFPGETEEAFAELCSFMAEQRFDHAGVFVFSPQEGTPAYDMPEQPEPEVAARRAEILMEQQTQIMEALAAAKTGETAEVIVDEYDGYADAYTGRTAGQAPDIDSVVLFTSPIDIPDGEIVRVTFVGTEGIDLMGRVAL
ncbi:MAG: 30S ribosomal protein S12 methylthiotransferase RimO [Oscillospiraceae bacterium]|nr:30S ribosomal protein S12 methylthiotransferase RimO [Oscillospiraceae bacterium]